VHSEQKVSIISIFINLDAIIKGPTVEGVVYYPKINNNLQWIGMENAFVGGDSSGKFRGIIASMISGEFIARIIEKSLNQ